MTLHMAKEEVMQLISLTHSLVLGGSVESFCLCLRSLVSEGAPLNPDLLPVCVHQGPGAAAAP